MFSVITVCYNSENTIRQTIDSVLQQTFSDFEYIIIDGGSTDNTMKIVGEYAGKIDKIVHEKDRGIYDAMNKGINIASGYFIGVLNSSDLYSGNRVLECISMLLDNSPYQVTFGNLNFFKGNNFSKIVRRYNSKSFKVWKLKFGWMPPHPSSFMPKQLFDQYGLYDNSFETGADYEFFVRTLLINSVPFKYVNLDIVNMQVGGATTKGIKSYNKNSTEIYRSLKKHDINIPYFLIYLRGLFKIFEKLR